MSSALVFLKLGGSLITEKDKVATPRLDVINRLAKEIGEARKQNPSLAILLGHGSGSFGHVPAKKYGTRAGVKTEEQWAGFVEVWQQAAALNHIIVEALNKAKLNAVSFPPSASITTQSGKIVTWNLAPIQAALSSGLLPVVYGDVVFDTSLGGTILSTEDLFAHLAIYLKPERILLAGDENGIFTDFPARKAMATRVTPGSFDSLRSSLGGAAGADVTGGMAGKVEAMLELVERVSTCEISIFSGLEPGNVERALGGEQLGTTVAAT